MTSFSQAVTASFLRERSEEFIQFEDISITSDSEQEPKIKSTQKQPLNLKTNKSLLNQDSLPSVFQEYPRSIVDALNDFTKPFSHFTIAKLLNYEANMSLLISQVAFRLGKIPKEYIKDKEIEAQLKLFQFYLTVQAMSNSVQLCEMIWVLLDGKISYQWPSQRKKAYTILINQNNHLIDETKAVQITININQYIQKCIKKCIKIKDQLNLYQKKIEEMSFKIFDDYCKSPFNKRIKLIPKGVTIQQIREYFKEKKNIPQQLLIASMTRDYFKSLYKLVFKINQTNKDKKIVQLAHMILVAQLHSEGFPFWILRHIETKKSQIFDSRMQNLKEKQSKQLLVMELRKSLPIFHLLLKANGFIKMMSVLNESETKEIAKEIASNVKLFTPYV